MKITTENLDSIFESFKNLKVLIIGDVMVDSYYWGKVDRISPEAPVPIVSVDRKESRMGGAANVALNIQALGATPILCSIIGEDEAGAIFMNLLSKNKQSKVGMLQLSNRKTTQKTRVIGNNHQLLRVDSEETNLISGQVEENFIHLIKTCIDKQKIDLVLFEDYDKGIITENVIQSTVAYCNQKNIPSTVDPKKRNYNFYKDVTLFKPNLKELKEGLKIDFDATNKQELEAAIEKQEQVLGNKITLITLSELGVFIKSGMEKHHIKAHVRKILDVSGAGDTVIAVSSLCLASGCEPQLIAELSNLAGGLVCENVGVVPINKEALLQESKRLLTQN